MLSLLTQLINYSLSIAVPVVFLLFVVHYVFVYRRYSYNYAYFLQAGCFISTTMAMGIKNTPFIFPDYVPFSNDSAIYIAPVVEEIAKFLPIAIVVWYFGGKINIVTAATLGAIGFATIENVSYLMMLEDWTDPTSWIYAIGVRVGIATSIHICTLIVSTLGLKYKHGIFFTLPLAMFLHFLYNFSALNIDFGYGMIYTASMVASIYIAWLLPTLLYLDRAGDGEGHMVKMGFGRLTS